MDREALRLRLLNSSKGESLFNEIGAALKENKDTLNLRVGAGNSLLHYAACNKDLDSARLLTGAGIDINTKNKRLETPLHFAITSFGGVVNDIDFVEFLLKNGADVNAIDIDGNSVIANLSASSLSYERFQCLCEILVKNGANPLDKHSKHGNLACRVSHASNLEYVLQFGIDINGIDSQGKTPLMISCVNDCSVEYMEKLIGSGADVKCVDYKGWSVLHYACRYSSKCKEIIPMLIKNGADPDARAKDGYTALYIAVDTLIQSRVVSMLEYASDLEMPPAFMDKPYNYQEGDSRLKLSIVRFKGIMKLIEKKKSQLSLS